MFKKKRAILVICLFVFLIGLKLGNLSADPPSQLSWSGGLFGDEGAHAHNARNKILFGKWITDDWNPVFYNPFLTAGEYCSFRFLGVGLRQVRLVTVIISFLGLVLLYRALRRIDGGVALGAVLLLGTNYIYLMYTRLGLTDSFMSAALLISFFFWQKGIEKEKILFPAGLACFATYVCKGTAVYFIAATIIALFFALMQKHAGKSWRRIVPALAYFFSGFVLAALIWLFLFYLPNREYFAAYGETWLGKAIPGNWGRLWQNLSRPKMFYLAKTPLVLLTPLFYLPFFFYALFKDWRKIHPAEFFAWLWWGGGVLFLAGLNYNPIRYFISVIPAFCLVTAFVLKRIMDGKIFSPGGKAKVFFWGLVSIWFLAIMKLSIRFFTIRQMGSFIFFLVISVFFVFMIYYLFQELITIIGKRTGTKLPPVKLFVLALFLTSILINGYRYFDWFSQPRYTVINTSRELGRILDKAYLSGLWSPLFCLENSHRALYLGEGNEKETFSRYPITHLILWDGNNREELRMLEANYPEVMKDAAEMQVYTVKDLPVRLFEIKNTDYTDNQ